MVYVDVLWDDVVSDEIFCGVTLCGMMFFVERRLRNDLLFG